MKSTKSLNSLKTDNYRKHTAKNPLQKYFINNFFNSLIVEVKRLSPRTILDAGCGEGFTLEKLRENNIGQTLTGIDFSESAIQIGHKVHPQLILKKGSIYEIPFKTNQFDLVMCTEVLEHLEYPEKALTELKRVTKSYCIISVPNEPWFMLGNFLRGKNISRFGNDIEHIQHWSRSGIITLVGGFFDIIEIKSTFPWTLLAGKKI